MCNFENNNDISNQNAKKEKSISNFNLLLGLIQLYYMLYSSNLFHFLVSIGILITGVGIHYGIQMIGNLKLRFQLKKNMTEIKNRKLEQ